MKARIEQLDGLRGIAVLWVIFFHYSPGLPALPIVSQIAVRGWAGVDLFFVLSGFLIGGIVIANQETDRFFSVFYTRRLLRIFPLYYLLLGVMSLAVWAGWMPNPQQHGSLLLAAFYGQNLATAFTHDYGLSWLQPTWSLAVEEHFYLVLPALVFFIPAKVFEANSGGRHTAGPEYACPRVPDPGCFPRDFARFFTLCRIDALFCGVLFAFLIRGSSRRDWLRRWLPAWYAGVIAAATAFVVVCHVDRKFPNEVVMTTVGLSLLGPLFVCVVAVALAHENGFACAHDKTTAAALDWRPQLRHLFASYACIGWRTGVAGLPSLQHSLFGRTGDAVNARHGGGFLAAAGSAPDCHRTQAEISGPQCA